MDIDRALDAFSKVCGKLPMPIKRPFMEFGLFVLTRPELNNFETDILDSLISSGANEETYQAAKKARDELAEEDARISKLLGIPNYYEALDAHSKKQTEEAKNNPKQLEL